jgi:hypothetical protein
MKKFFSTTLLAFAFAVSASAVAAQESGGAKLQKDKPAAATTSTQKRQDKAQKGEGNDCSPQRAGVRCSRPKPKNPWFFGK